MEKVRPWCDQPSDRGRLKIRSDQLYRSGVLASGICGTRTLPPSDGIQEVQVLHWTREPINPPINNN